MYCILEHNSSFQKSQYRWFFLVSYHCNPFTNLLQNQLYHINMVSKIQRYSDFWIQGIVFCTVAKDPRENGNYCKAFVCLRIHEHCKDLFSDSVFKSCNMSNLELGIVRVCFLYGNGICSKQFWDMISIANTTNFLKNCPFMELQIKHVLYLFLYLLYSWNYLVTSNFDTWNQRFGEYFMQCILWTGC